MLALFLFPVCVLSDDAQAADKKPAVSKKMDLQSAVGIYKGLISRQQAYFKATGTYAQTFKQLGRDFKGSRLSVCQNWCWVNKKHEIVGYIFSFRKYCNDWCADDAVNNPQCVYYKDFYYCINGGKTAYKLDFFDLHNGPYLINGNGYGADMMDRIRCSNFECEKLGAARADDNFYYIQL